MGGLPLISLTATMIFKSSMDECALVGDLEFM
jgi:hypothetical protein